MRFLLSPHGFIAVAVVFLAFFHAQADSDFPDYTYLDHPTHQLSRLRVYPEPVIMRKYFFRSRLDRLSSEDAIFSLGGASYNYLSTGLPFAAGADVLTTPASTLSMNNVNRNDFATFVLNRPARIVVLLELNSELGPNRPLDLSGAPADWTVIAEVVHTSGDDASLGDAARWMRGTRPVLRKNAVAVEVPMPASNTLALPHPRSISVDGRTAQGLSVLFSPADSIGYPMVPHAMPALPGNFRRYLGSGKANPASDPPVPNQKCPQWLHDSYVVRDRTLSNFWLTWHPVIDPVYWCYFDHEHGSHPGYYRPRFHFTSFYTPDSTTFSGRQDESHNGFKVFTFKVDDGRICVITLHAHNSQARRFVARHHTMIFSIHAPRGGSWSMEMEVHMKADFGFLEGLLAGTDGPIDTEGEAIKQELQDTTGQKASRQVYTINFDNYPSNFDPFFWVSTDPLRGRYEEWRAPMNCAKNIDRWYNSGLKFEFHEQQTAMKCRDSSASNCQCTSRGNNDNQQILNGDAMRRSIVFVATSSGHQRIVFGEDNCEFTGNPALVDRGSNGVFYTDAFFKEMLPSIDSFALRQYIKVGFSPVTIGGHRAVTNKDPWNTYMSYAGGMVRPFQNTEQSVDIYQN